MDSQHGLNICEPTLCDECILLLSDLSRRYTRSIFFVLKAAAHGPCFDNELLTRKWKDGISERPCCYHGNRPKFVERTTSLVSDTPCLVKVFTKAVVMTRGPRMEFHLQTLTPCQGKLASSMMKPLSSLRKPPIAENSFRLQCRPSIENN